MEYCAAAACQLFPKWHKRHLRRLTADMQPQQLAGRAPCHVARRVVASAVSNEPAKGQRRNDCDAELEEMGIGAKRAGERGRHGAKAATQ